MKNIYFYNIEKCVWNLSANLKVAQFPNFNNNLFLINYTFKTISKKYFLNDFKV